MPKAKGTAADPWMLKTPPGTSEFTMHRDTIDGTDMLVCTVGKTVLWYEYRCVADLHAMLKAHGDWMELGSADEQKPAKEGTVAEESRRRLVRAQERVARPLRHVRPPAPRSAGTGRGGAQPAWQPDARQLSRGASGRGASGGRDVSNVPAVHRR